MEKVWVSLDGGGTKTQICACDATNQVLFDQTFSGINYKSSSLYEVEQILREAMTMLHRATGCQPEDFAGVVMGISGCDTEEDLAMYHGIVAKTGIPSERLYLCNDTEFIFRSQSGSSGICLVAGTGSIACAYNRNQLIGRVGGWGAPLSDGGSGYWIGARVLSRMIRWLDGVDGAQFPVFDHIFLNLGMSAQEAAATIATMGIAQIASYAPLIFNQAQDGDALCIETVSMALEQVWQLYETLVSRHNLGPSFDLVVAGGIFSNDHFRASFCDRLRASSLHPKVQLLYTTLPPALAGLAYVRKRFI